MQMAQRQQYDFPNMRLTLPKKFAKFQGTGQDQRLFSLKKRQLVVIKNKVKANTKLRDTSQCFPGLFKAITLIKINKRSKEQERVLLITDKAVYNLKPKEYHKCQRRIDIDKIVSVSEAKDSDEFTIHVPEEYDYRYKTVCAKHITSIELLKSYLKLSMKSFFFFLKCKKKKISSNGGLGCL
ncbi:hypothetical protein RFI_06394 [Reticulomyxa filosa]|uniref:TH1 domain-containing protein n=1 Tax=Reticulomyxa filosa TaxID=46433 RepID=X6NXK2_RETFI|nr:hypothetical protein RFI_06394 [Reticulomyxa filosa]|eukprot:ETO30726.1 hypothetical protein RFI_06394 [Reticulomyxa filosa]